MELTKRIGEHVQIVGDDLLVTNPSRIKTAIEKTACNALLLKVNQVGSFRGVAVFPNYPLLLVDWKRDGVHSSMLGFSKCGMGSDGFAPFW